MGIHIFRVDANGAVTRQELCKIDLTLFKVIKNIYRCKNRLLYSINHYFYAVKHLLYIPFLLSFLFLPLYNSAQIITTVVGTGTPGATGDGGSCKLAELYEPNSLVFDKAGNMYITDAGNNKIRKVNTTGIITTIAGTGLQNYSGDGGPATAAELNKPTSIAIDTDGNLYTGTIGDYRIRKISKEGIITTIAGTGSLGYGSDNIPATACDLYGPYMGAVDKMGNIIFTDRGNYRVCKINTAGIITTICGNGTDIHSGDNGPATAATLKDPAFTSISSLGDIFIPEDYGYCIRKIDAAGIITTFAGTGIIGNDGDGGAATAARFTLPNGVAFDDTGNVYIADYQAGVVRKVSPTGIISTLAGNGVVGYSGDGGPAIKAQIMPNAVAVDNNGYLYIADSDNDRIRRVVPSTVGINEVEKLSTNVSIFPNPVTSELFVTASFRLGRVVIVNSIGQAVYTYEYFDTKATVDISALPVGAYLVCVNGTTFRKFIKE